MDAQFGAQNGKVDDSRYDHGDGFSSILRELSDRQRAFLHDQINCPLCNSILVLRSRICSGDLHLREELSCDNCQVLVSCKIYLIQ